MSEPAIKPLYVQLSHGSRLIVLALNVHPCIGVMDYNQAN